MLHMSIITLIVPNGGFVLFCFTFISQHFYVKNFTSFSIISIFIIEVLMHHFYSVYYKLLPPLFIVVKYTLHKVAICPI